jgi:hypothetical protein
MGEVLGYMPQNVHWHSYFITPLKFVFKTKTLKLCYAGLLFSS